MQIEINEAILKGSTKKAKLYLQSQGFNVSAGNVYETLACLLNYPSWNVLADALKGSAPVCVPSKTKGSVAAKAMVDIDVLRKKANRELEKYDFSEAYDGSTVVDTGNWEWEGTKSCTCSVYLTFDDDDIEADSTRVRFTVEFDVQGRITGTSVN